MVLMPTFDQAKVAPELAVQLIGRVASHIEATAPGGTIFREGGDENMAMSTNSVSDLSDILGTIRRFREKVKHRPVVPNVKARGG